MWELKRCSWPRKEITMPSFQQDLHEVQQAHNIHILEQSTMMVTKQKCLRWYELSGTVLCKSNANKFRTILGRVQNLPFYGCVRQFKTCSSMRTSEWGGRGQQNSQNKDYTRVCGGHWILIKLRLTMERMLDLVTSQPINTKGNNGSTWL